MKPVADTLCVVMPFLYAALVLIYGLTFFKGNQALERIRFPLLLSTAILHLLYLTARGLMVNHPPITGVFEIMSLLAASITVAYMYIEWRTRTSNTGAFILLLAFLFQTASSLFIRETIAIPEYLHSLVLGFHVSAALLGYTGISLSAVYGFLYLMLYHEIKSTRFGLIYSRLPSLEMLETMSNRSEVFGFRLVECRDRYRYPVAAAGIRQFFVLGPEACRYGVHLVAVRHRPGSKAEPGMAGAQDHGDFSGSIWVCVSLDDGD